MLRTIWILGERRWPRYIGVRGKSGCAVNRGFTVFSGSVLCFVYRGSESDLRSLSLSYLLWSTVSGLLLEKGGLLAVPTECNSCESC